MDGRHFQSRASIQYRRVHRRNLVEFRRRSHFSEEIQVIVAGTAVRAQSDGDPFPEHRRNGRYTDSQFHVAFRIVRYLCAGIAQHLQFFLVHPDGVNNDRPFIQHSKFLQMADRREPVTFLNELDLIPRFRHMGEKKDVLFACHLLESDQRFCSTGIRCMAEEGRGDQRRAVFPFINEGFCNLDIFCRFRLIRRRKIDEALAYDSPHPHVDGGLRHTGFVVITVAEGGGPGEDHFGHGQPGTGIDHVAVHIFCLSGEDALMQPFHERHIIGIAPVADHGQMIVGIHETRQDNAALCVQNFFCRVMFCGRIFTFLHENNPAVPDADNRVLNGIHAFRQSQKCTAHDENIKRRFFFHFNSQSSFSPARQCPSPGSSLPSH